MRNIAIVNLKNLEYNVKAIKSLLPNNTKFCAVVKADGYGLGGCECANAIYKYVDCFAVAIAEEGVALRFSGIDKDILVLSPILEQDFYYVFEYNLTVSVDNLSILKKLKDYAEKIKKPISVHIKYNTGMNRFGVDDDEKLKKLLSFIAKHNEIKLKGFYSHFACPENSKMRNNALNKFLLAKKLVKGYNNNVISHISASGGLLCGVTEDMVRVGIMLYGFTPFKTDKIKLKKVLTFLTPTICYRKTKGGEHIFYGKKKKLFKKNFAIVRYGYADGLNRKKKGNLVSNRCMDVSAIKIHKSSKFIEFDVKALSKNYGTIDYEILTKLCHGRAERRYRR